MAAASASSRFQKKAMKNSLAGREVVYTQDSNTVFYYNDYRVVLLLDFSQSATTVYPGQGKSYSEKMRESITFIMQNLIFQVKNKYMEQSSSRQYHHHVHHQPSMRDQTNSDSSQPTMSFQQR